MAQFCPRKYEELVESAPGGPVAASLPVITTGPGERLIACECGNGVSLEELGGPTVLESTLGECAMALASESDEIQR